MDDALLDIVLGRIDGDAKLSEGTTELLLAACQGDDALGGAVGGDPPPRPQRRPPDEPPPEPVGAVLSSITVQGFRGVGPEQTLTLQPGRGLTVVVGRNGSGKSTFAEALEVLLTGSIARLDNLSAVFRDGWRNLHAGHPVRIAAELHVEGAPGTTIIERAWAEKAGLADSTATLQVAGEKVANIERLGWADDLTTYRPFLAHSELEAMLDSPSALYDRLASVLGLDDLAAAQRRLAERRLALETTRKSSVAEREEMLAALADVDDERATKCRDLLAASAPDPDELQRVVTGGAPPAAGGSLDVLRRLTDIVAPDPPAVDRAALQLREAAGGLDAVAGSQAARARAVADLLDRALRYHEQHPAETACPVCGRADALGGDWHEQAADEVARLRAEADAAERAHAAAEQAIEITRALIRPQPPAVAEGPDVAVDTTALAQAWSTWTDTPRARADAPDELRQLADHLVAAVAVGDAVEAVHAAASAELAAREDRWSPVAARIATWLDQARAAAAAVPVIRDLRSAERWLKDAHDDIRNDRLRPIAERAQETWRALRHESNVDLGSIRLSGSGNQRRVQLNATVDDTDGNALGVMSQGEVNALALSVFLPRATLSQSPFRFVMIDDPVQAMDPAKVDGLARVLRRAAQTHQVVVFTHDDRLPNAVRHLELPARIVEVQRRPDSVVEITPAGDPVSLALRDARAIASDRSAPPEVRRRVVPGLCRLALESALTDIVQRRGLRTGRTHREVEAALEAASTVTQKAALALFSDADDGSSVLPRLNQLGRRHADTYQALKRGSHGEPIGNPHDTVTAAENLIGALQAALP